MTARSIVKSFLTEAQQHSVRRTINAFKRIYRKPLGIYRAQRLDARVPYRPGNRRWRSDIPFDLHISFQEGTLSYTYRGIPCLKHPIELALYTDLLWNLKPRTIIEIGSKAGGAALWLADQLRSFGIEGRVLSIDIKPPSLPFERSDIRFLHGDANRLTEVLSDSFLESIPRPLLVIEDASHHYEATLAVLRFFHPFLRKGEYIVVEDANVSDMGDDSQRAGGPGRAISEFLLETGGDYEIDVRYCDRYGHNVTGNPNGYLKRVDRTRTNVAS